MMKTLLTTILTLLLYTGLFAQTIDKLDEKNGFKDFTLGDNLTKWGNQLSYEGKWDDGSLAYLYKGTCCNKVFSYEIEKTILRFSKNKLVGIYLTTQKFQKGYKESGEYTKWRSDDFESIKSSLSYLFGKPTTVDTPKDTGEVKYIWAGKKVMLLSKYEYLGVQNGDRQQISIVDINFLNSDINSGF